ncbi:hypothetical protein C8J45_11354 [Sphingomonas sp. PP-CE-3G-477]|uniref:hypothetical protein n=1 Tax=Sphingomonas sp. PP-CE-3G-477 TaxID=2135660 RepID=UPI000D3D73DC|nr:hypothetical protein [Sphingomonas sp. PP-CE-3G-477]PTQ60103.1 hypothetical protein C8J45_11354 [Sphingomonas sp. PP-CE-3G-477]
MGWRKLFGMDHSVEPASPPEPAGTRFAIDLKRMFNLDLTSRLHQLFDVPRELRDAEWTTGFFASVWNASLEIPDLPFFEGPDGFVYCRFHLPWPDAPFDSNALANQAPVLVERGYGAAIFASRDATEPEYVLPMGVIDSLLRFDGWDGDPLDRQDPTHAPDPVFVADDGDLGRLVATRDHEVLIGAPSAAILPPYTARALHHHLTRGWGITDPRIALLVDPSAATPRSLMLDRGPEDFPDAARIEPQVRMLFWYLPPHTSVVLRPDTVDPDEMTPLRTLFPAVNPEAAS